MFVFLVFSMCFGRGNFGCFNYSKMASFESRTYSNTFWIILGTSKMFTKSGPLQSLFITKHFKTYKKISQTSLNNIVLTYHNILKLQFCNSLDTTGQHKFEKHFWFIWWVKNNWLLRAFSKNGILRGWNLNKS